MITANNNVKLKVVFLLVALIELFVPAGYVHAVDAVWKLYNVELSGFNEKQLSILDETIQQLTNLKPGRLTIKKKLYKKLSRFEEFFGFSFDGKKLVDWTLSRIGRISYKNSWSVAAHNGDREILLGDHFFEKLGLLERLYLLIHEARHSDGYPHVACPAGYRFVSAGTPDYILEGAPACDKVDNGAYGFQAAFIFELFAYSMLEQETTGLVYNSSIARIIN